MKPKLSRNRPEHLTCPHCYRLSLLQKPSRASNMTTYYIHSQYPFLIDQRDRYHTIITLRIYLSTVFSSSLQLFRMTFVTWPSPMSLKCVTISKSSCETTYISNVLIDRFHTAITVGMYSTSKEKFLSHLCSCCSHLSYG